MKLLTRALKWGNKVEQFGGANVLIREINGTKPWKILLVCTILTFSTKNWCICCRAGGGYRCKIPTLSLWLVQDWVISDNSGLPYHSFWKVALFLETTLKWTDFFFINFDYSFYFIPNKTCWILILASMFCPGMTPFSMSTRLFQKRKLEFAIFLFALSVTSFNCLSTLLREYISLFWSIFPYCGVCFSPLGLKISNQLIQHGFLPQHHFLSHFLENLR